jgi:hypothetical protein
MAANMAQEGLEALLNGQDPLAAIFNKFVRKVVDGNRVLPSLHNIKVVRLFYLSSFFGLRRSAGAPPM